MTDPRGVQIDRTLDDAGQLVAEVSPNETRSFVYDLAGRQTAWTDATGATTVSYDNVGRLVSVAAPAGTVSYTFNAAGERTSMTQPEGVASYAYDQNGFTSSITDWRSDEITFVNDPNGRVTGVVRPNGVDTARVYDPAGRLTEVQHSNAGGAIESFMYTLDGNGNRTGVVSSLGAESYTLDSLNRLTDVAYPDGTSEAFGYDATSNRTSHDRINGTTVGYTLDAAGQIVSDTDGVSYSYDQAGNLLSTTAGDTFSYDDYGRTVSASANGVTQAYAYDAVDVRVDVDGVGQVWDRNGLPTLLSTSSANYVHGPVGVLRSGTDYLLGDAIGSLRVTIDDGGVISDTTSYTAFGEQLAGAGVFGFAGEQTDPTGLVHLRARQYAPGLGRFTAIDPVQPGSPGTTGWGFYGYAGANPTTWSDPGGKVTLTSAQILTGVAAAATLSLALTDPAFLEQLQEATSCLSNEACRGFGFSFSVGDGKTGGESAAETKTVDETIGNLPSGDGKRVKEVQTEEELWEIFEELARGGQDVARPDYEGIWIERDDGVGVGLRDKSKSGGLTIDIKVPGEDIPWKVHLPLSETKMS